MGVIGDVLQVVRDKPDEFWGSVATHLWLSCIAIVVSFIVSFPLGIWLSRRKNLSMIVLNVLYIGKIIPSLAVLALLMPFVGVGFLPSLIALIVFAVPTMLINTVIAFREVDANVIEAARGMGMDHGRILRRIEIPLSLPVVLTGLRTATVEVIAGATLAAFIGGGGLGDFIVNGIALARSPILLAGAIPICILAFSGDVLFGGVEKLARRKIGQTAS